MNSTQAVLFQIFYSTFVIITLFIKPPFSELVSTTAYRCIAIIIMSFVSFGLIYYFELQDLFFWFNDPYLSKCAILSTIALFFGPIIQNIFTFYNDDYPYLYRNSIKNYLIHLQREIFDFETFKTIIIGPLTEEMIYRSFACTLWEKSGISKMKIIFALPFIFGVSHLNKVFLTKSLTNITLRDFLPYIVVLIYTTLFGWWESFVWLKTHSYLTCVFLHAFCNYMQFPNFAAALNWGHPVQKIFLYLAYLIGLISFGCSIGLIQTTK